MVLRKLALLFPLALLIFFTMGQTYDPATYRVTAGGYRGRTIVQPETLWVLIAPDSTLLGDGANHAKWDDTADVIYRGPNTFRYGMVMKDAATTMCNYFGNGLSAKSAVDGSLPGAAGRYPLLYFDLSPLDSIKTANGGKLTVLQAWVCIRSVTDQTSNDFPTRAHLDTHTTHVVWKDADTGCNGASTLFMPCSWDSVDYDTEWGKDWDDFEDYHDIGPAGGLVSPANWGAGADISCDVTAPSQLYLDDGLNNAGWAIGRNGASAAYVLRVDNDSNENDNPFYIAQVSTAPSNPPYGGGIPPLVFMTDDADTFNLLVADSFEAESVKFTLAVSAVHVGASAAKLTAEQIRVDIYGQGHPISNHTTNHWGDQTDDYCFGCISDVDSLTTQIGRDTLATILGIPAGAIDTITYPGGLRSDIADSLIALLGYYLGGRGTTAAIRNPAWASHDSTHYMAYDDTASHLMIASVPRTDIFGSADATYAEMFDAFGVMLNDSWVGGRYPMFLFAHDTSQATLQQIGWLIDFAKQFNVPIWTFPQVMGYYRGDHAWSPPKTGTRDEGRGVTVLHQRWMRSK